MLPSLPQIGIYMILLAPIGESILYFRDVITWRNRMIVLIILSRRINNTGDCFAQIRLRPKLNPPSKYCLAFPGVIWLVCVGFPLPQPIRLSTNSWQFLTRYPNPWVQCLRQITLQLIWLVVFCGLNLCKITTMDNLEKPYAVPSLLWERLRQLFIIPPLIHMLMTCQWLNRVLIRAGWPRGA